MPSWRANSLRLGAMRERVNVQTATETVDDIGQTIRTWATTYTNEPARFEPTSGGETLRGKQVEAGIAAIFTVHYRDYSPEQRIVFGGRNYGIVYVKPVDGGRRYIELHCRANGE